MKRISCVVCIALACMFIDVDDLSSQKSEGHREGQSEATEPKELRTATAVGWMLFSLRQQNGDDTRVESATATLALRSAKGTKPSWQVPLVAIRAELWGLPEPSLHSCQVDCVTLVLRNKSGTVLVSFKKNAWSLKDVNALDAEDTAKEEISLTGDAIVYRRFWVIANAADSDFAPADNAIIQFYLPDGWRVGSSGWLPMARSGAREYIAMVGTYQSANDKAGGPVRELRVRALDGSGLVANETTLPITCTEYALSSP